LVLLAGVLIWASGLAYLALRLGGEPDFLGAWLPGMAILGAGGGLTLPTLSGLAIDSVPGPRFAVASSLNSVASQLGGALGIAILIAIAREEALGPLRDAWWVAGACILAGAVPCALLVARGAWGAPAEVAEEPAAPRAPRPEEHAEE